jgi:dihydrolipoamide dehydrogenase
MSRGVATLMKKYKVQVVAGEGRLDAEGRLVVSGVEGEQVLDAKRILLAVGSGEKLLPGMKVDAPRVVTSRELLEETTLPESIVIVGGGAIGVEFGYVFASFGVAVTIVEMQPQLLPGAEPEVARELARSFKKRGIAVRTGCAYRTLSPTDAGVRLEAEEKGKAVAIDAERCLIAVGRAPRTEAIGAGEAGLALERGYIAVNERYESSLPHVLAIGDAIESPQLAHVASAEGVAAVEMIAGERESGWIDYRRIPACVYSHPEVASVGLTEQKARDAGYDVRVGVVPYRALGRAVAGAEIEGLFKLVCDARYGEILGGHIVGGEATELVAEIALAMSLEGTAAALGHTVHAHPTLSEGILEAALAVVGTPHNL